MYFHGYRSYQKKRLKNKYGKYLMGMLVVTALVTFFVQRQEALEYREKSSSKNGRDGSGGCAGTGASL